MKKVEYQKLIDEHIKVLESLQYKSGLFAASHKNVDTGYDKAWLRDNFYECLPFVILKDWEIVKKTYRAILAILKKHEYKIDWAIREKPNAKHKYIHARFHPETFDEFWEDWGNKQNDAVAAMLFQLCDLEYQGIKILIAPKDKELVQKLILYLESIHYWNDFDSGMWEEDEEIHASSVGSCVAALKKAKQLKFLKVSSVIIEKGSKTLNRLLPRESEKKFVDLALLSLIYPYDIVSAGQRNQILTNVEYHLVRKKGVIRYKNDHYYNKNPDGYSEEAEWTMGLSWLSIIYHNLGNKTKALQYFDLAAQSIAKNGKLPELYFSNTNKPNENTPLGWSESMFIIAAHNFICKHVQ